MEIVQILIILCAIILFGRAINLILVVRWFGRPKPPGNVITVDGKRVYFTVKGQGSPTIIVESGLASASPEWRGLQEELSKSTRVLTYDRGGYGWSDTRQGARTSRRVAEELRMVLDELSIDPPYLLVGHSLGALFVNHFCRLYPQSVAGVILLDPVTPDHSRFRQELLPRVYRRSGVDKSRILKLHGFLAGFGFLRLLKPIVLRSPLFAPYRNLTSEALSALWNNVISPRTYETASNEYSQLLDPRSIVDLRAADDFPPVPLRVVTHDSELMKQSIARHGKLSLEDAGKVEDLWQELMRGLVKMSPNGEVITTEAGDHLFHLTHPDVVIGIILDLLRKTRK